MIASAAAGPPSGSSVGTSSGMPAVDLVHRQPHPDQPGRADGDVDRRRCRRAALGRRSSAVRCVSAKPSGPVQALAPPEFKITARSAPVGQHLLRPHHRGGLDPVAGEDRRRRRSAGPVLTTRARSGLPLALSPAATPAARKPAGRGDAHSSSSSSIGWPAAVQTSACLRRPAPRAPGSSRCRRWTGPGSRSGVGQRLQQPGEHADQRVVERSVDAEADERPDAGDVAGHGVVGADHDRARRRSG